jgi:hypothetical protein
MIPAFAALRCRPPELDLFCVAARKSHRNCQISNVFTRYLRFEGSHIPIFDKNHPNMRITVPTNRDIAAIKGAPVPSIIN